MQTYEETLKNGKVSKVSLESLEPSPYNTFSVDEYDDLKGSILSCGLITPLTVIGPSDEGKYQIISGERRFRALSEINSENPGSFDLVPVYIVGDIHMDVLKQKLLIESSNLETRDQYNVNDHRLNVVKILKEMKESGDADFDDVAEELGKYIKTSRRYRNMYIQIFDNGTDEIQKIVRGQDEEVEGPVKFIDMAKISGLDPESQHEAAGLIKQGESPAEAYKKVTKEAKKKPVFDPGLSKAELRTLDGDYSGGADEGYEDDAYSEAPEKEETSVDSIPKTSSAEPVDFFDDWSDGGAEADDIEAWLLDAMHKSEEHTPLSEDESRILDICRKWVAIADAN